MMIIGESVLFSLALQALNADMFVGAFLMWCRTGFTMITLATFSSSDFLVCVLVCFEKVCQKFLSLPFTPTLPTQVSRHDLASLEETWICMEVLLGKFAWTIYGYIKTHSCTSVTTAYRWDWEFGSGSFPSFCKAVPEIGIPIQLS